ncbi:electron transfer flavoprotein [Telmatospirillum sp.]|uniref:electron transfer flavoprotein n=1 Tax=Telmatospirillum sp. TaxID=2079197 RepID=UPI0028514C6E|nr:electron transfer flavoprotein [Telmatospirillum sp.]MDR3439328.1 electron transfer flavoprotein [Telmatospirillum sp.]
MNIVACFKLVPEEQDIIVNGDRTLNLEKATPKISLYDLNAVEAATELAAAMPDSKVSALSVGGKILENSKARKDILSRGPDALYAVIDPALESALPRETAAALAAAVGKIGSYDLIICGEGSGDLYAQQVGLLLGSLLSVPVINEVSKITAGDGKVTVERTLETEVEVLEVPLPAVVCVTADINTPKIPSMKAILAAGKKPITVWSVTDIGASTGGAPVVMQSILAPAQADRKKVIVEGDSDDKVAAFVESLRKVL